MHKQQPLFLSFGFAVAETEIRKSFTVPPYRLLLLIATDRGDVHRDVNSVACPTNKIVCLISAQPKYMYLDMKENAIGIATI